MKAETRPPIHIASVLLVAALLLALAPARSAHAHANSTEIPSSNGPTANAPGGGETGQPAEAANEATHHKHAHAHAEGKRKKPSFMHRMRDKAMDKLQKFLARRQEQEQPKHETKQIPKEDIE